jgi:hypothetical protein
MLHHVRTGLAHCRTRSSPWRSAPCVRAARSFGSDSLPSDRLHHFHEGDTYNPVEPAAFLTRLQAIGFSEVMIIAGDRLLFRARKEQE